MLKLDLSPEEAGLLNHTLSRCLADLEVEICHTDHAEFKLLLKERRHGLATIAERLSRLLKITTVMPMTPGAAA